jgi:hypothetical protein
MNKLKQASKTTGIPPVNIKRNDSYLPALLEVKNMQISYISQNIHKNSNIYHHVMTTENKIHAFKGCLY